jgi:hypothetical protein
MARISWEYLGGGILGFVGAALITGSAAQMQNLESYTWAVGGAVAAVLPAAIFGWPLTLPMGLWCAMTLKRKEVKAGFRIKRAPVQKPD